MSPYANAGLLKDQERSRLEKQMCVRPTKITLRELILFSWLAQTHFFRTCECVCLK